MDLSHFYLFCFYLSMFLNDFYLVLLLVMYSAVNGLPDTCAIEAFIIIVVVVDSSLDQHSGWH